METLTIVSSDGHATARMAEYRPYLERRYHDEFDAFLVEWDKHGSRNFDRPAVLERCGPDILAEWEAKVLDPGRHDGNSDPARRIKEMAAEGIAAEVLFPDFGVPFELYSVSLGAALGHPPRSDDHVEAGNRAANRWLVDFCAIAPERFAGIANISWHDVDATVAELQWARNAGLKGVVLPMFDPKVPLYSPRFERIWSAIEDLGLIVHSHSAMSSVSNVPLYTPEVPHPGCAIRLFAGRLMFECHEILAHLIWGGVLERHPGLQIVMTEQGTGWIIRFLQEHDYAYEGSFLRPDVRGYIRHTPSEYYARQCHMGSSLFSRAEVEARQQIGIDKMMIGMDYPHQEGTILEGSKNYLRATLGAADVPIDEARRLLGQTAAEVYGFDLTQLAQYAVLAEEVLTPPEQELYPYGDVHKPLV